jgi:hypothetical protein
MAYVKAQLEVLQQIAATGLPLVGGRISAYVWDTVTPQAMYTSSSGAGSAVYFTLNTLGQPQSAGGTAVDIFLDTDLVYKFIITDDDAIQIGPVIGPVYPGGQSDSLTYTSPDTGGVTRALTSKLSDIRSAFDFGCAGDGSTIDTINFQAFMDAGGGLIPDGTYLIDDTLTIPTGLVLIGQSPRGAVIKSSVVGASLFDTDPGGVSFMYLANFTCEGNNLTGASGNGHCFNFIDPAISSGSNTPQVSVLENIYIRRFRGTDNADNGGVTKVASAGVIIYDGLGVTMRRVFVQTCGHGFYVRQTQNCRITDCLVEGMQKAGVFSYANQNLIIENSDLIECGDGSTDSGYPVADAGMGIVVSYEDDGGSLVGSKLKSHYGDACIVVKGNTQNFTIHRCWIRGTAIADVQYRGIYAERIAGLTVRDSIFFPTAGDYSGTQTYRAIELYNPSVAPAFESTIEGNVFMDAPGLTTEFNVGIRGNATTRLHRTTIRNNRFGSNASISSAATITRDIYIDTCLLDSSIIGNNTHYAPTNATRTAGVQTNGAIIRRSTIGPSNFTTGGGTITANYSGTMGYNTLHESVLWAGVAYATASIADGARATTTVTVTGANFDNGDMVTVSYSKSVLGLLVFGYISAADTVTVVFQNNTGGAVNTADGAIYVKVESYLGTLA